MMDLEMAANVYFGEFVPIEDANLVSNETPESILIGSQILQGLSEDAKQALDIFIEAADDCFLGNGKLRHMKIRQMLRDQGWAFKKVFSVIEELKEFSRSF